MNSKSYTTFRDILQQKYGLKIPDLPKLVIWALGLATVIALTVNDFVPLIKEYTNNNRALQVKVVLFDNQLKPPQIVLALPISKIRNKFGDDLMLMAMSEYRNGGNCSNESYEISSDLHDFDYTSLETIYNNLTLAFVEKLFINIDQKILPDEQYPLSRVFMSSMMNYLEWIALTDYFLSDSRIETTIPFNLHPSPEFYERFENYDKKLDLLANQTMRHLCRKIKYTELEYPDEFRDPVVGNRTCIDLLLHSDFPVFLDGSRLWVTLSAADEQKQKEYRFAYFPEKSRTLIKSPDDIFSTALVYGDPGILYQSVIDPIFITYLFQTPVEKEKRGQRIFIRYKIQMRARETRLTKDLCSNETSVISCVAQCTKLWVLEQCKCFPFCSRIGLAQSPLNYCTPNLYAKCNITELPKEITDPCIAKCQRPCGYTVYSWQISYDSFEPLQANVSEFILKLVPMLDTFAEFTLTVKDTPEQFFSQLAGLGSFYLGFSGLSLFAVATWMVDWWKRYRKIRLESAERKADTERQDMKDGMKCCRCDGKKHWREDTEWLAQIEANIRRKCMGDTENLMKEQRSPREERSQQ